MPQKVLVGFDGSVDRTVKPIRIAGTPNQYFATIEDYGMHITSKAGLSCSLQNEVIKSQAGGNSVFVAQSLNAQGYDVYLVGLLARRPSHRNLCLWQTKTSKYAPMEIASFVSAMNLMTGKLWFPLRFMI